MNIIILTVLAIRSMINGFCGGPGFTGIVTIGDGDLRLRLLQDFINDPNKNWAMSDGVEATFSGYPAGGYTLPLSNSNVYVFSSGAVGITYDPVFSAGDNATVSQAIKGVALTYSTGDNVVGSGKLAADQPIAGNGLVVARWGINIALDPSQPGGFVLVDG